MSFISTPPPAFGNALFHVRDHRVSGAQAGTFTASAYRTRILDEVVTNQIAGASLSLNQVTLPIGRYMAWAQACAVFVSEHTTRLYDTTGAAVLLVGAAGREDGGGASHIFGEFQLAAQSVLELQHYCATTRASDGFGRGTSNEEYVAAEAMFWKVA